MARIGRGMHYCVCLCLCRASKKQHLMPLASSLAAVLYFVNSAFLSPHPEQNTQLLLKERWELVPNKTNFTKSFMIFWNINYCIVEMFLRSENTILAVLGR